MFYKMLNFPSVLPNAYMKKKNKDQNYIRDRRSPIPEKASTSHIMSAVKATDTKPELLVRKALWNSGVRGYRLHWKNAPGSPDIAFPSKKVAIFVHGCYWHRCPNCKPHFPKQHSEFWANKFQSNQERDQRQNKELDNQGWKVITLWECQLKKGLTEHIKLIINLVGYGEKTYSR
jgi:DNA mismatch endonuclease (patch repair protein)